MSDYLQAHSREELVGLLKAAPLYTPGSAPQPKPPDVPKPKAAKAPSAGQGLEFDDLEPWPSPVDGRQLLDGLRAFIQRFAILSPEALDAVVLWIVHTYLMSIWRISSFLVANSPTKQCGKTKLLEVVSALVCRPLPTSNITGPALFRVIDKLTPTLLFDEAENWITDKASELRGLLNAGHTKRTAWAVRTVGDKHDVARFSTWAAKFIALIGALPDTMMDRSIVIPMRRKRKDERVEVLLEHQLMADTLPLRRQLVRFADDYVERLATMQPQPVEGLRDRAVDNWSSLFAIANVAGGDWPARARAAAIALSGGLEASDDTPGLQLLEDCYAVWLELDRDAGDIASADLIKRLQDLPDRPWSDFRGGKGISPHWLAKRLREFDVVPAGNVRVNGKRFKGYRWGSFADAWDRYLVSQAYQRTNANKDGPEVAFSNRPRDVSGTDAKMRVEPINTGLWDGGTVATPDPGSVDDGGAFEEGEL